ncbi:conserved hypothetical protein [Flavobacterium sp. 9AF]|uniref:tetratricopeptide repeat protein n=1 Tax=Flavobacterium sp. 9AF TaxID=2653142 RepID=UPI0012EF45F5|nr:tetratricopeptide repeat protein [Flavobacterium sp. 9AF]VXB57747.1 conserved hypothetical protein [Flavobacterium sp. 9AF]
MSKIVITFLLFINVYFSFACLNGETKILENGAIIYEDYESSIPYGHQFYLENVVKLKNQLDSLYKKTGKIAYLSDLGYLLTIEGKLIEARDLYLEIEKKHPNRYSTASNLGTVYELLGENDKALFWINKSISLDSKSHFGSEWLHSKILEAKIKGEVFYNSKFLLDIDFDKYSYPISTLSKSKLHNVESALYYQLNERISFIKSNDPIIAVLLFELGNINMLNKDFKSAEEIFKMAKEYGLKNELISTRLAYIEGYSKGQTDKKNDRINPTNIQYNIPKTILLILIISFLIGLVYYFFIKKHKKI